MKHYGACSMMGVLLATAAFATMAAADVPPPDDYVEDCTLALQQKPGDDCVQCQASYLDNPNPCEEQYAPLGYSNRCNSWGTAHTEIWCKVSEQGAAGSAGAANLAESTAGAAGESADAEQRPGPSSGGAQSTGGATAAGGGTAADPKPSGGGPSTGGASNVGGNNQTLPVESDTGGTSATQPTGGTNATQPAGGTTSTQATSAAGKKDDGGCSLATSASGVPQGLLPGLGIALALLGARRRARR